VSLRLKSCSTWTITIFFTISSEMWHFVQAEFAGLLKTDRFSEHFRGAFLRIFECSFQRVFLRRSTREMADVRGYSSGCQPVIYGGLATWRPDVNPPARPSQRRVFSIRASILQDD